MLLCSAKQADNIQVQKDTGIIKVNIIIYNEDEHETIESIYNKANIFNNCNIIRIKDHTKLKYKLSSCFAGESIAVIYINKKKDMEFLELMEKYFIDIKLLIYLTIKDNDISSRAYALSPRMVISDDNCKELLPDSIEKIIRTFYMKKCH